jgi:hypothetical protein
VVVTYHKSGGFAGIDETLTVYADGRLELQSRYAGSKTAQVDPSTLGELLKLLASPEFGALQPSYETAGADLITYTITVSGSAQPAVVTMDAARHPRILSQVIEELEKLGAEVK